MLLQAKCGTRLEFKGAMSAEATDRNSSYKRCQCYREKDVCTSNAKSSPKFVTIILSKFVAAKAAVYEVSLIPTTHHGFHKRSYCYAAIGSKELFVFERYST